MTYINTILNYGAREFIRDFAAAGINGVIVPDLPLEEVDILQEVCREYGVDLIQFIAPTSTVDRITAISKMASGFLYCISSTGVTGVRAVNYQPIAAAIRTARRAADIPVAIGFGIGSPAAACEAARYADAVIVGSAIVERLSEKGIDGVRELIQSIRREMDKESG